MASSHEERQAEINAARRTLAQQGSKENVAVKLGATAIGTLVGGPIGGAIAAGAMEIAEAHDRDEARRTLERHGLKQ